MALRPGISRLMSSHFMPRPRRTMILASSAGVHLPLVLLGEPEAWLPLGGGRLVDAAAGFRPGFCWKTA